ncbi:amino acid adenylation domain-containing protein [Streptomyces sp. TR06-5]|uniref:amino acid adenylation domain-containing protein n=1 Tax=Streptomyces sp. TR06-5 TaxID=3385976 RepID=UPI0039A37B14
MDNDALTRLRSRLHGLRNVLDCALLPHEDQVLAYVVPDGRADFALLHRRIAAAALQHGLRVTPVLVDGVPLLPDGTPDRVALAEVPVVPEALLARYRTECRAAGVDVVRAPAAPERRRVTLPEADPAVAGSTARNGTPSGGTEDAGATGATGSAGAAGAPTPAVSTGPELVLPPGAPHTLPEALVRTAADRPESGLHLRERDRTVSLAYPELLARARRTLGGLRAAGLRAGDRVILQLPSLEAYFPALWACFLGGIVPVTVARPPGYASRGAVLDKLHHAWQTLREPPVICSGPAVEGVRSMQDLYPMPGLRVLDAARLAAAVEAEDLHAPDPDETALLQLSSGSTGRSKAIRITHRGVMQYVAGARLQGIEPHHTTVNWLPLDHVAGLLMFHLRDTVLGCPAVHTPTEAVLADPLLWLDLLEEHGAAHSWSPNFGFKLVAEALRRERHRSWDLSSVRSLINAGEQCTLPVMRAFLDATRPFGLAGDSVLLAWGMAETCTAISYKRFGAPGTVHRVRKSSLRGELAWVDRDVPEHACTTFLSMGPPTAGASFRICDDADRTLPEGRIGRLQVRSGRVTPGYLDNPGANEEAFRGEGWFDTGDLAFLKDGELTVTGRRKEVIIINGSHYFCHELEDVVGAVDGVTAGSVGACGVPDPASGSERLVVFFVPDRDAADEAGACVRNVQAALAGRFQLTGVLAVPLPRADFPRTTSGKIQRTELRRRFLQGDFDTLVPAAGRRQLSPETGAEDDDRSVPDAVHRVVWEPLPPSPAATARPEPATTLVVADEDGLAAALTAPGAGFADAPVATPGTRYARTGPGRYTLDLTDPAQWKALWRDLAEEGLVLGGLLHLTGYARPVGPDEHTGGGRDLVGAAGLSLVLAAQGFRAQAPGSSTPRVVTVSRGLHRVTGHEPVGYTGAAVPGVAAGLAVEWPEAAVHHVDLEGVDEVADARELAEVLGRFPRTAEGTPLDETAVRAGRLHRRRWIRTDPVPGPVGQEPPAPFSDGSCLVVTGGLGGVGIEVLSELLRRHRLYLLLLGRTPVAEDTATDAARSLARLRHLGGDVAYAAVDVTDAAAVADAVASAEARWGRVLDGALHLAGTYDSLMLADEEPAHWRAALAAKTTGAVNLAATVTARPGARFVSFSSLLTVTPAARSASYMAANRFLEAFTTYLETLGVPGQCLVWGLWSRTGMNRGEANEAPAIRRGLLALTPDEGRRLAAAVLARGPGCWFVGLDDTSPALRGLVRHARPTALERLRAVGSPRGPLPELRDLHGRQVAVETVPDPQPAPADAPPAAAAARGARSPSGGRSRTRELVLRALSEAAGEQIEEHRPFHEAGLGSLHLMRAHGALEREVGRELPRTLLFEYPTVADLVDHLTRQERPGAAAPDADDGAAADRRIAVVGMAGRFPGAPDLDAYWRLVLSGETALRRFTADEAAAAGVTEEERARGDRVLVGGTLDGADLFDASFFGISAREASLMEPQQRLLLEVCHEALEGSGYAGPPGDTRVGVFAGTGMNLHALQTYLLNNLTPTQDVQDPVTALQLAIGNQPDFAATRVAHRLGLQGPAVGVQTACSSSLVAVHLAAQALLTGDADLALAGAAAVHVPQHAGYRHVPGSILSRTGACRAFDAAADGTVGGNGVAAVVLKRLDRALADQDTVHAVILGSAVNNDGAGKVGFTAPSVSGQRRVVRRALRNAGVSADTVGYVETHGTGTELGDPIEFQALTEAFRETTDREGFCALGSAKATIGHLDSAAGMAGLIKAVLALRHGRIPPLANFTRPNPALALENSPFRLPDSASAWPRGDTPRRAGVSALGVGGTNAHLVLEEAPAVPETPAQGPAADGPGLLPLSARTPEALVRLAGAYRELLRTDPPRMSDAYATAALRRPHHEHRLTLLGHGATGIAAALDAFLDAGTDSPPPPRAPWVGGRAPRNADVPVAMVFSGQGTQRHGMARELYRRFDVFRRTVDDCERLHRDSWGSSLTDLLLAEDQPGHGDSWTTDVTQPALFSFHMALRRLWESWGVRPQLFAGHSLGEYAALCAAGALSTADGLYITAVRGRLMQRLCPPGAMAAVAADRTAVTEAVADLPEVELAVVNAPGNHVLAGPAAAVAEATRRLESAGHAARALPGDRAFHCALVEPALEEFGHHLARLDLRPLTAPVVVNAGGALLPAGHTPDAAHFLRQARGTVDWAAVVARLEQEGAALCLEAGADATLTAAGRRNAPASTWIASQPQGEPGPSGLARAVAELHCRGVAVDWKGLELPDGRGRHIPLPTHPLDRTSHWISAGAPHAPDGGTAMTHDTRPAAAAPGDTPGTGTGPGTERLAKDGVRDGILTEVRELVADQLSLTPDDVPADAAFFDLGADSLLLINMIRRLEKTFGVRIAMRELFEEADTSARLADVLAERGDPERTRRLAAAPEPAAPEPAVTAPAPVERTAAPSAAVPASSAAGEGTALPEPARPTPAPAAPAPSLPPSSAAPTPAAGGTGSEAGRLVERQLDLMSGFSRLMHDQLRLLSGSTTGPAEPPAGTPPAPEPLAHDREAPAAAAPVAAVPAPGTTAAPGKAGPAPTEAAHGPRVSVPRTSGMASGRLTTEQRAHVDALTQQLTARTATSKELAQRHRRVLADSRAVVGFRSATKEMQYPLAARSARGPRLKDVDGNAYVDITMGFGVLLFGHEPDFLDEAVRRHLSRGMRLGPRSEETGRAAELLADLTGFDRVAFANSGTEANSAAIRLARAAVGRDTVVMFRGSYHGHADNVLGQAVEEDGRRTTVPASSGIPANAVEDLVVLDYGAPESLTAIEAIADRVAAVLVEPVQSRHPGLQPADFLRSLRGLTERHGIVLLFDEMLTGFRPHQQGAQGVFGVTPDLATYGKVLGGGYPIGAVAGRADLMDGIDGGHWSYGDDSYPPRDTTFFGGTYIQHPLAMTAAEAVLTRLRQAGPQLQQNLNATTEAFVGRLNRFFEDEEFPVRIAHFGSLFRFEYRGNLELFFHHLLLRGVYVWEWRNFFLSTAHTDADLECVEHAVRNALWDMRRGGFLAPPGGPRPIPAHAPPLPVPDAAVPHPGASPVAPRAATPRRQPGRPGTGPVLPAPRTGAEPSGTAGTPDFSLYFFGDYPRESETDDKYAIVLDGARFADSHGFHAVWLPERHFHSFGGVFPNPAVLGAALARETSRIRINAGSVVLPLHHPVRVAEEWSVIDNLSGGRVGIGCASGWHANDFVLQPDNYGRHKDVMYEHLRTVQRLWRGEEITSRNGHGDDVGVRLYPRPVQQMPPFYTAIVGNPDSYRQAARNDLGVVTNLMTQSVEDLARNIALYRQERAAAGLDPAAGRVVVLLHSYLGEDAARARAEALPAFSRYMRSSLSLFGQVGNSLGMEIDYENTPEEDMEFLLERAYHRYCESRALIGTPDSVAPVLDAVLAAGADEIAHFVDFGVTPWQARDSLPHLDALRRRYQEPTRPRAPRPAGEVPRDAGRALTFAQQRLWFLDRMHPGRTAYHECSAVRLEGPLDVAALRTALGRAVERHPALRSVFREVDGEPRRIVLDQPHDGPELLDARGEEESEALDRAVAEEYARPFDLARGPLLRTRLLRCAPDRHVLLLTVHHIVFDSVSAEILTADLGELYAAAQEGRPDRLPEHTDGGDHAAREQEAAAGPDGQRALAHWRERLAGAPPYLELPADKPRPPAPTGRGDAVHLRLDAAATRAARALGRDRRATTFMVMLTAFYATVQAFTGQDDLVVGTPVAHRPAGTEDSVGFFVNTLALRTDLGGDPTFVQALDRVRRTAFDAYEHQDCPFEEIVRAVNPQRDPSRAPLAQVFLEYETKPVLQPELPGVRATALDLRTRKAPFDLTLFLTDLDDGLRCRAEYSTDLFEEATVRRFLDCFAQVLAGAATDPERPLSSLAGPTAADRSLLARTGATPAYGGEHRGDRPAEPVHRRVLRRAAAQPDALAVAGGAAGLTYGRLAERSAQVARRLREEGCAAGDVVGVLLPRGAELAVSLLAVARTGAVALPLDPTHPRERHRRMLDEAGAVALLTADAHEDLPLPDAIPVLTVTAAEPCGATDEGRETATGEFDADVHDPAPDDLLCVLYTSGSTGRPKGVGIRHGAMANVADWHHREFGTTSADRGCWISSPAFDASGLELWAHLTAGASLHPVPDAVRAAPEGLRDWLFTERITSAFFTTPLAEQLLEEDWPADAPLRLVITGGDRLRRRAPRGAPFRLVNIYGPTENTVVSTWTDVAPSGEEAGDPPIGLPVAGTCALVLDSDLRTVPVGVPGELYVGGAHLASGYVARPELTAERFVEDPGGRFEGRLYRTGDLVRRRNDGLLEFLGRTDHQVKIRGHRVEPGEVESVLAGLPGVREAAVVARTERGEQPYLAAYAVLTTGPSEEDEPETRKALTDRLADLLPDYLIPRAWVFLPELPLNSNGKVDRSRLPAPDFSSDAQHAPPATALERNLHDLWARELDLERVSVTRSFFELGGHSLNAVRLLNRMRAELGAEVSVLEFFEAPTVRGTAARLGDGSEADPPDGRGTSPGVSADGDPGSAGASDAGGERVRGTL